MNIEELFLNDELTIGEECYFDHQIYIYQGKNKDGKYIVKQQTKDSETIKYLQEKPQRPKLPTGIYLKNNYGEIGELTGYVHMLKKIYYVITLYNDVFKGYTQEKLEDIIKNWYVIDNPYLEETDIYDVLDEINERMYPYEKQIRELKDKISKIKEDYINPIEKEKEEIYKKCKHKWRKDDAEEVSKNSFRQRCECEVCGCIKPCYYNGSGLNAKRIYKILLREGSGGVWRELEEYYKEIFKSEE